MIQVDCEILDYIPDNGFLLYGKSDDIARLLNKTQAITWIEGLLPQDKIAPIIK